MQSFKGGNEMELRQFPGTGFWGDFEGWSTSCTSGSAICGLETPTLKVSPKSSPWELSQLHFISSLETSTVEVNIISGRVITFSLLKR
jgi:hypothetical protein